MLQRLGFPDVGPHRRFVSALAIDAVGSGVWIPLSMLYFLHQTSLTLVQLGLAMTVANLAVIPVVPLIGTLVDRHGPRLVMQAGNAGAAAAFALYPFAHSMLMVTLLVFAASATRSGFWSALGPMVTQITQTGEREIWFGFLQAMRNAGYGVGGVLAAVALTIGTGAAYQSVVLLNAGSYVLAFLLMLGVAGGARPVRADDAPARDDGRWWVGFADRGYRALLAVILCYALAEMTLNVAMPVYFVDTVGLPGWVPGTVFVINTVMIGVGQGLVVRAMTGAVRRRVLQAAIAFTAASFAMFYAAGRLPVAGAAALVLVAAVVYTLGEMTAGPVVAALAAEAPPPDQRGRYMASMQLAWSTSGAVAPLLYSALLHRGALALWGGTLLLCLVWALLVQVLGVRMPLAGRAVTNLAQVDPTPVPDPATLPD
ncbi:MFS transporter [Nocardioides cynanchi]|uniref:MFS transporter n=1 Tax=Nocardioides cynanchi TaxID=2558918 RepID=UPI001786BBD8|nr:MFS transporter [Nocardioides cynanchi]